MKSTGNFYTFKDYLSFARMSDFVDRRLIAEGDEPSSYYSRYERAQVYMKMYGLTEDSPFCDHPFYEAFEKYDIDWKPYLPDFLCSAAFTNEELEQDNYLEDFAIMHPDYMKMEEYGPHILRPKLSFDDWCFFLRLVFASYGFYYDIKVADYSETARQAKMSVSISISDNDEVFELDKLSIAKIIRIYEILLDLQIFLYVKKSAENSERLETIQAKKLDSFNVCKFKAYCLYRGLDLEEVDNTSENLNAEIDDYMRRSDDDDDLLDEYDDHDEIDDPFSELITDFKETYYYSDSDECVSTDAPENLPAILRK